MIGISRKMQLNPFGILRLAVLAGLYLAATQISRGAVLDWNNSTISWGNGTLSNTYNNVAGSGINMSIVITVGGTLLWQDNTPATTKLATGGVSPAQKSLTLSLDFANTTSFVDVAISFSQQVKNVSFSFYDVDRGPTQSGAWYTFQDQISGIQAANGMGTWFNATTVTTGSAVTQVNGNTVRGTDQNDSTSGAGNVGVVFAPTLSQIKFRYEAGPNSWTNPAQELIAMSSISFIPAVPEPSTVFPGGLGAAALVFHAWRRRHRSQNELSTARELEDTSSTLCPPVDQSLLPRR